MVTVTIDEITLNAVKAALEDRRKVVEAEVIKYEYMALNGWFGRTGDSLEDAQRALVWNIAALHETEMARKFFSEVSISDHPVDASWTSA